MTLLCLFVLGMVIVLNLNPIIPLLQKFVIGGNQWVDVASDFTGNEDAMRLGYFWRIIYAWVSPKLVPGNPVFHVCGGVNGFGNVFCVLFILSVVFVIFSRKNVVTLIYVVIFLSSQALPLKFVGHARYVPQIWSLPALAIFNLAFSPCAFLSRHPVLHRIASCGGLLAVAGLTLMCAVRTLCVGSNYWRAEYRMQEVVRIAKKSSAPLGVSSRMLTSRNTYTLWHRMKVDGISLDSGSSERLIDYDPETLAVSFEDEPFKGKILLPDNPSGWLECFGSKSLVLALPIRTTK